MWESLALFSWDREQLTKVCVKMQNYEKVLQGKLALECWVVRQRCCGNGAVSITWCKGAKGWMTELVPMSTSSLLSTAGSLLWEKSVTLGNAANASLVFLLCGIRCVVTVAAVPVTPFTDMDSVRFCLRCSFHNWKKWEVGQLRGKQLHR